MDTSVRSAGVVVDTTRSPSSRLRPVPIGAVRLDDIFWAPRLRTTRDVTLRHQYELYEEAGRFDNFRRAAGRIGGAFQGGRTNGDSDVYKWLEAASYALAAEPDAALDRLLDRLIDDIAAAQLPDGYLHSYFGPNPSARRLADGGRTNEHYVAGHLLQAGVAHYRATGKRSLFDAAVRVGENIARTFGPGLVERADSHPGVELALVELYRATGNRTFLDRAVFLLEQRGRQPTRVLCDDDARLQNHLPVREQRERAARDRRPRRCQPLVGNPAPFRRERWFSPLAA
ncbi:MAG: glycoside hydrolase family 127 protein [Chloroflexi bacterium]|nr:glycoside hydrolase family 127 protein [Chloroflexota bacterium]